MACLDRVRLDAPILTTPRSRERSNPAAAYNPDMSDAKKTTRTIELVRPPDENGVGVFCIAAGGKSQFYAVREIPCEIGGRGFAVHRLGLGTLYHVRVGSPAECECEC